MHHLIQFPYLISCSLPATVYPVLSPHTSFAAWSSHKQNYVACSLLCLKVLSLKKFSDSSLLYQKYIISCWAAFHDIKVTHFECLSVGVSLGSSFWLLWIMLVGCLFLGFLGKYLEWNFWVIRFIFNLIRKHTTVFK